jgi:DNA processing protein
VSTPTPERLRAWLRLLRAPGIGPVTGDALLAHFGDPETLFRAGAAAWRATGLSERRVDALRAEPAGLDEDLAWWAPEAGRHLLCRDDPRYPPRLRALPDAPLLLFVHGDPEVLVLPQLAIVGSRAATPQGAANARAFAEALAARGLTITSGLAVGIDAAAHEGALAAQGATVAVCATGLDRVYPARHRSLAKQIAAQGALVSELPIGVGPQAEHFPRRNRLIAGLSLGVLVVEAARESGSLITARLAGEQGREVFAIPGSIHSPASRGCHQLIRQGAKLVESVDDILEELGPQIGPALREAGLRPAVAEAPSPVIEALGAELLDFDQLAARCGLDVAALSSALLSLELEGRVVQSADGRYSAVRRSPDLA